MHDSPLFQLSLGSKELFHSNFLGWLFLEYPKACGSALSRYLTNCDGDTTIVKVLREYRNRDLTIYFANGQELVIENKVKSLPYIEQLRVYGEGSEPHQNFLLLSLLMPAFADKGIIKTENSTWNVLTYSDLSGVMKSINAEISNEYHHSLITDYVSFITALGDVFSLSTPTDGEFFTDFYLSSEGSALEQLNELRMGDVYQKLRFEALAGRIQQELLRTYPESVVVTDSYLLKDKPGQVFVLHGMTRSMGMVSVSYVLEKGLFLTVQIQGGSYRHMVAGYAGYGKASKTVAERLKTKRLWFNFNDMASLKEYPRGVKEFNEFAGVDFYRSVKLDPKLTVKEVVALVTRDMELIEKNKGVILTQLG